MQDVQAIRTLKSIAWLVLLIASFIGTIVLFAAFLSPSTNLSGEQISRISFNPWLFGIGAGVILAGLLFWAVAMVLASIATSLLVLREYYEQKIEQEIEQEDEAILAEYKAQLARRVPVRK